MQPTHSEIPVGAVVLSPGFEPFDARRKGEFGWGYYPNVLTSIQFERMASLAGSTRARIERPSDGQPPKRVAFIHCVGSRDKVLGNDFCSSACCMYTAKQITMAKEIQPGLDITVFTMDVRASGKGYERYMDNVMSFPGVTYRRCIVSSVYQYERTKNPYVNYVDEQGRLGLTRRGLAIENIAWYAPVPLQSFVSEVFAYLFHRGVHTPTPVVARKNPIGLGMVVLIEIDEAGLGGLRDEPANRVAGAGVHLDGIILGNDIQAGQPRATYRPKTLGLISQVEGGEAGECPAVHDLLVDDLCPSETLLRPDGRVVADAHC